MKRCENCGKELNDNMSYCPECGTALVNEKVNTDELSIPYIDQIWEDHLKVVKENPGCVVQTFVGFLAEHRLYDITIISNNSSDLKILVSFKRSDDTENKAFERFKAMDYFESFTQELTDTDKNSGYIDFSGKTENVKPFLYSFIMDVCKKDSEKDCFGYRTKVDDRIVIWRELKDGLYAEPKGGCMGVVVALVAIGATLIGLI